MKSRLNLVELESRIAPAWNFGIDGDEPTFGFDPPDADSIPGTIIFRANTNGAVLNPADIEEALETANVRVDTGTSGFQSGQIIWAQNSATDDLKYFGSQPRTLTILANATGLSPKITLNQVSMAFNDNVDLELISPSSITSSSPGSIALTNADIDNARSIEVDTGGSTTISTGSNTRMIANTGSIDFKGFSNSINGSLLLISENADISFTNTVFLGSSSSLTLHAPNGQIEFVKEVTGGGDLYVSARTVFFRDHVGNTVDLDEVTIAHGLVHNDDDVTPIHARLVRVGANISPTNFGVPTLTMPVVGSVIVEPDGVLAPVGNMSISGNLSFDGGALEIQIGSPTERVTVGGTVTIGSNSELRFAGGTGTMPNDNAAVILQHIGQMFGTFSNAPIGKPLLAGMDAVAVSTYVTIPGGIIAIQRVGGLPVNSYNGFEFDGTAFTVKLTGPGQLVVVPDETTSLYGIVVRGSTKQSKVTITTRANASDRHVGLSRVSIQGYLGSLSAANAQLFGDLRANGTIGSIRLDLATNGIISVHGAPTDLTRIQIRHVGLIEIYTNSTRLESFIANQLASATIYAGSVGQLIAPNFYGLLNVSGKVDRIIVTNAWTAPLVTQGDVKSMRVGSLNSPLTVNGKIGSLICAGDLQTDILADDVGTLLVKGVIKPRTTLPWEILGGISRIDAGAIWGVQVNAEFLGDLKVKGIPAIGLSGDVINSIFSMSSHNGLANELGIRSVVVSGNVTSSEFRVPHGNVNSFTTGRMHNSRLFVGATPSAPGSSVFMMSQFTPNAHRLGLFKTTAAPIAFSASQTIHAFINSMVIAETIGTVRISSLNTFAPFSTFGVRFHSTAGSVQVASASNQSVPLKTNLVQSITPVADSFYFIRGTTP